MRYIDRSNCKIPKDKSEYSEITRLGKLTRTATRIAEENGLGLLKTRQGYYRIIKACGLGAYEDFFSDLAEVDKFFKNLKSQAETKH